MRETRKLSSCIAELMQATRLAQRDPERDDFIARFRRSYPDVFRQNSEALCEAELWSRAQRLIRPTSQAPEQLTIDGCSPLSAYHVKTEEGSPVYRFTENMTRADWESALLLKEESLAQDQARLEDDRKYLSALMSVAAFASGGATTLEACTALREVQVS